MALREMCRKKRGKGSPFFVSVFTRSTYGAGIFKESMGAIGTEEEEAYRTGPPGYIG